jgi:hypothetical protein
VMVIHGDSLLFLYKLCQLCIKEHFVWEFCLPGLPACIRICFFNKSRSTTLGTIL